MHVDSAYGGLNMFFVFIPMLAYYQQLFSGSRATLERRTSPSEYCGRDGFTYLRFLYVVRLRTTEYI